MRLFTFLYITSVILFLPIPRHMTSEEGQGGLVCRRLSCRARDWTCLRNKTKTISWQVLQLPSLEFITAPVPIIRIQTAGYSTHPNLYLSITAGNDKGLFRTSIMGDKAILMLTKPMKGPTEKELTMVLENWDRSTSYVISRHVTHVYIIMNGEAYSRRRRR